MADSAGIQQGSPAIGAAGLVPAAPGAGGTEGSGVAGGSARITAKKATLRSSPRPKKLEKLGVYSSCKVCAYHAYIYIHVGKYLGWSKIIKACWWTSLLNASAAEEAIAALYSFFFFLSSFYRHEPR